MNIQKLPSHFISFFLACAIILVGCQPKSSPTPPPQEENNTTAIAPSNSAEIPVAINADILLDPALTQDADSLTICQYIYEGLVTLDSSGVPQPALAESWIISDDQLDYIFTIRNGAKFNDGTPITPDVIVGNFNRWFDPNDPLHTSESYKTWESIFLGYNGEKDENKRPKSPVDGIQKVDVNTVIIHLNRAVPDLLTYLAYPAFAILSTDALATSGYGERDSTIISSGPYIVSTWNDDGLVLSPNPNYLGSIPEGDLNFSWK